MVFCLDTIEQRTMLSISKTNFSPLRGTK